MKNFLSPTLKKNWAEVPLHAAIFSFFPATPLPLGHIGSATGIIHSTCIIVPWTRPHHSQKSLGYPNFHLLEYILSCPTFFYAHTYYRESIVLYGISFLHSLLSCAGPLRTACCHFLRDLKFLFLKRFEPFKVLQP